MRCLTHLERAGFSCTCDKMIVVYISDFKIFDNHLCANSNAQSRSDWCFPSSTKFHDTAASPEKNRVVKLSITKLILMSKYTSLRSKLRKISSHHIVPDLDEQSRVSSRESAFCIV
mmetsp:Transcript_2987/g.5802  ORF Transcript_2987/g.5802 Transcript_2987/m.5802 type:complete len:116 (+) Transcript_2987:93-440(+)